MAKTFNLFISQERTSRVVQDHADRIVKWNTEAIVEEIRALVG